MVEISMLHHVASDASARIGPRADYNTSPNELAAYVRQRRTWQSLSTENVLSHHRSERCFLITFDDGYYNNLTEALPILEHFDTQAIIFVTTGFIDGSAYPYELELASVIQYHDALHIRSDAIPVDARTQDAEKKLYRQLRQPLKIEPHALRETTMERLADLNGYDRHHFQNVSFLSWEDIRKLDQHPLVTIGAHTDTHPVLTHRFPWTAYQEMRTSKRELEEVLDREIQHLSYPYGRNNVLVRTLARLAGFRWAFTTERRCIEDLSTGNPMALPRFDIQDLV
ncbi:peptidoglycan/xylan/chitin deacetylase (PgdA/CDA1 family) [Salinibacter ruber]|uniref:polysaccharide deacetylase family protein n=1 Tax=Salinibacter ruber TaxID=146919 RepID=UPI002167D8B6|nr:polysaccharide deacetylase family protein [Salinibacter ruber]MCS3939542.1 peptidoglycan/xylan/chitin deacetylase (PgdA/CDA1 family) [Salinibacter ruber]